MILLQNLTVDAPLTCPYFPDRECTFEYFLASELTDRELNGFISKGWRKFGYYYFRPVCGDCRLCIPIRVIVDRFTVSKNQKKILNKCRDIEVEFRELEYSDEIFDIYSEHNDKRFGKESYIEDILFNFYYKSCPSLQSEYYLQGRLIAVGFIDKTDEALSSVYLMYRAGYDRYSLGTFSIIKEVEFASSLNLNYYYLGYYIKDNHFMAYKNRFRPNEKYDWNWNEWVLDEC